MNSGAKGNKFIVSKVISGGQTGADRAALDWAIENGFPHGGWCPKGRKAEDGPIDSRYQLQECPSAEYVRRTEMNVRDSDATVIFTIRKVLTGGSRRTAEFTRQHGKPCLHLANASGEDAPLRLRQFIQQYRIRVLNVAGSRASKEPEVGAFVTATLSAAFFDQAPG